MSFSSKNLDFYYIASFALEHDRFRVKSITIKGKEETRTYWLEECYWEFMQLPLRQWRAGNVYLLVLSRWNIAENSIALMELQVRLGQVM